MQLVLRSLTARYDRTVILLRDLDINRHGGVKLRWRAWCSVSVRW